MKIQCDVCEKAPASVICCADEAALCASCDVEIHAANKLASKHQKLVIHSLSSNFPRCDICQEKAAFIFCVEDRALFCQECNETIHIPGSLSGNHQCLLATGIQVALSSTSNKKPEKNHHELPNHNQQLPSASKVPTKEQNPSTFIPSAWAVDEFLQLCDYECSDKKELPFGFAELEWFSDIDLFHEQVHNGAQAAAEVPELPISPPSNVASCKPTRSNMSLKKPRIEISDEEEYFTVPDLG